ncbi:hypothetical protein SAMN05192539_100570 [Paraburkholderia diazotrophica]|uniref:Uncharacterized protein n=1 Tax=Paraburkholderia diazotrophica TaxID=667676 RepID=A0A1H6UJT1_9BURK|nr:hypothetical protein SAMN05192539_100570 [Paraburkholderia diazotrophica]
MRPDVIASMHMNAIRDGMHMIRSLAQGGVNYVLST